MQIEWQETADELHRMFKAEDDVARHRKVQYLWLLRTGNSNRDSCRISGISERTGQRYASWYRQGGVQLVLSREHGGRRGEQTGYLDESQYRQLKEAADAGRLKTVWDGVEWVKTEFEVTYSYEGMRSVFKRLKLNKKVPRKQHIKSDLQAQAAWKKGGLLSD